MIRPRHQLVQVGPAKSVSIMIILAAVKASEFLDIRSSSMSMGTKSRLPLLVAVSLMRLVGFARNHLTCLNSLASSTSRDQREKIGTSYAHKLRLKVVKNIFLRNDHRLRLMTV